MKLDNALAVMGVGRNLLVVGAGEWYRRLSGYFHTNGFNLCGIVDLQEYSTIKADPYLLSEDRYYKLAKPLDPLPKKAINNADLVQIASWNNAHRRQTQQVLEAGKFAVVEKTLATYMDSFDRIIDFIAVNRLENKVILNEHYPLKPLAEKMRPELEKFVKEHGKINLVEAKFLEKYREEDRVRRWIFRPEHGGITMDWIHPIAMLVKNIGAEIGVGDNEPILLFNDKQTMEEHYPSGVSLEYDIYGALFVPYTKASVSVGKGFSHTKKAMKFGFKEDETNSIEFNFENEDSIIHRVNDGKVTEEVIPKGSNAYSRMMRNILNVLDGGKPFYSVEDIKKIYTPIFELNEKTPILKPRRLEQ